jgi:hypothetical protein
MFALNGFFAAFLTICLSYAIHLAIQHLTRDSPSGVMRLGIWHPSPEIRGFEI